MAIATCQLETIYNNLATMTIYVGNTAYTADTLSTLKQAYNTGDLPKRVIHPLLESQGTVNTITFNGNGQVVVWRLNDLMMLDTEGQGKLSQHMPALIRYMAAYTNTIRRNIELANNVLVENFTIEAGKYKFGDGSYYGVNVVLSIREIIE